MSANRRTEALAPDARQADFAERRGSLLFAHFGLSGPVILDVSRVVSGHARPQSLVLECDFLPTLSNEALVASLREQAAAAGKKQLVSLLERICRGACARPLLAVGESLAANESRGTRPARIGMRRGGIQATYRFPYTGTLGFEKAEVTAGGVALDEIDSSTMQSKLVPNLYLAGEVLDLDGPIGGYNFQAAWSTGTLAGRSMSRSL